MFQRKFLRVRTSNSFFFKLHMISTFETTCDISLVQLQLCLQKNNNVRCKHMGETSNETNNNKNNLSVANVSLTKLKSVQSKLHGCAKYHNRHATNRHNIPISIHQGLHLKYEPMASDSFVKTRIQHKVSCWRYNFHFELYNNPILQDYSLHRGAGSATGVAASFCAM